MRKLIIVLVVALAATAAAAEKGFKPLFNGKNLDGWDGDPKVWSVKDGAILGSTEGYKLKTNTFLISKKPYANFILKVDMKLRNHNSGIQFRSEALPDWVVRGLQADAAEGNYWGSIYDERGKRGIIVNGWKDKAEKVVKANDWNEYEVLCDGKHIQLKVNGMVTADIQDDSRPEGIIAFQCHAGPPMQVWFRNVRIKVLK